MTSRENYLKIYRHEIPDYVPGEDPFDFIPAPGEHGADGMPAGSVGTDWFGVSWTVTKAVGMDAGTPTPGLHVMNDMSEWPDKKDCIPSKEFLDTFDWKGFCNMFTKNWNREERISYFWLPAGFFERMHHLMPFEEAVYAFYDEPEYCEEYLDALLEYKKYVMKKIKEYANPDVLIFFDDYGATTGMFFTEDM